MFKARAPINVLKSLGVNIPSKYIDFVSCLLNRIIENESFIVILNSFTVFDPTVLSHVLG